MPKKQKGVVIHPRIVPEENVEKLRKVAYKNRTTVTGVVNQAISTYLEQESPRTTKKTTV